jgi:hypothetical protein
LPGTKPIVGRRSGGGKRLAPANDVDGGAWKTISESTGRDVTRELLGLAPVTADACSTLRRWNRENQLDKVPDRGCLSVDAVRLVSRCMGAAKGWLGALEAATSGCLKPAVAGNRVIGE